MVFFQVQSHGLQISENSTFQNFCLNIKVQLSLAKSFGDDRVKRIWRIQILAEILEYVENHRQNCFILVSFHGDGEVSLNQLLQVSLEKFGLIFVYFMA